MRVIGTNYDGSQHWRHSAYLVLERGNMVVLQTFAGTRVETEKGEWISPYHTRGHYWTDRWYNVIRVESPRGAPERIVRYYCNVATPAEFDGENLHYVDLQLDVIVEPRDGAFHAVLIDEDDFERARETYAYPQRVIEAARAAAEELLQLARDAAFPFTP